MKIKDLLEIDDEKNDYLVQMSCMNLKETIEHKDDCDYEGINGYFYDDCGISFITVWADSKIKTTLKEFKQWIEAGQDDINEDIISWDEDDGNIIELDNIVISDKTKRIFLI